jgi:hypothetical protein
VLCEVRLLLIGPERSSEMGAADGSQAQAECGLAMNTAQLVMRFALSNLWMARRQLLEA